MGESGTRRCGRAGLRQVRAGPKPLGDPAGPTPFLLKPARTYDKGRKRRGGTLALAPRV